MPAEIIGSKLVIETNYWRGFIEEFVVVEGNVEKNVIYSKNVCDEDCGSIAKIELIPKSRRVVVEVYAQMEEHSLLIPMWREFRTRFVWDGDKWREAWTKEYVDGRLARKNVLIPEEDVSEPDEEPEEIGGWELEDY